MIDFLKIFFLSGKKEQKSPDELRDIFTLKYRNFRTLLTANNTALEIMAEMEQVLARGQSFSMSFVRAHSTALMVNVYNMIQNLSAMSAGRYSNMERPFAAIQEQIRIILDQQPVPSTGERILPLAKINRETADLVGEKMANLGEVGNRVGLRVSPGFAISRAAAQYFLSTNNLQDEINRKLQLLDPEDLESLYETSAAIQQLISRAALPAELEQEILAAYDRLQNESSPKVRVSVRSSAIGEDSGNASFAGQYRTELQVSREFLAQTYKEIIASKYSSQALTYRLKKGYREEDVTMGVGCQAMVEAAVGGVMYTRDPRDMRSYWICINAVRGGAKSVVDGTQDTEQFLVSRKEPHEILRKTHPGTDRSEPALEADSPAAEKDGPAVSEKLLTEEQAKALAQQAIALEDHFGAPQDIEWSIDQADRIFILQSRPLVHAVPGDFVDDQVIHKKGHGDLPLLLRGGVTASPGVASGPVYIVRSNVDLLQFPRGAVLVTPHPLPQWAPLLARAAALITETGSMAGHLATVSREFGIPALFGIKNVTGILKNNEIITLDATAHAVYQGEQEAILAYARKMPDLMGRSPVQRLLKEILKLVTPLNLTDPASPFFAPSRCKTLHDITRFCHEKAVIEMFNFGKEHRFNEMTAKRIVGEVPSEWWVIDLADGFRAATDRNKKTISISDIVSLPMLAIWEGINAVPWQGPPPVNIRGFGAILFRSTMNPDLEPAVRSTMASKNYFLVSRNFCNLSVRLGYHFAMAEAYVGERLTENYISFSFKGGAADDRRRSLRVKLIADILEHFDFRIESNGDTLTARVEKRPGDFLLERLKILGYLTMHTRQIDMVMEDQAAADRFRYKLMEDINTFHAAQKDKPA